MVKPPRGNRIVNPMYLKPLPINSMNSVSTFRKFLLRTRFAIILAVVLASAAEAQVVKGKVSSKEDGAVMPGVNILIKGTQTGTTSNASGDYSIDVSGGNPVLVFSFVGYVQRK
jgi:hypothetical protein